MYSLFLLLITIRAEQGRSQNSSQMLPTPNPIAWPEIIDDEFPYPCLDGECNTLFEIDTLVSPGAYLDDNNYWHVEFNGLFYSSEGLSSFSISL